MRKISKKRLAVVAGGTAIVMAGAGVGFAYWTSTGTGSGTAATGTAADDLVVTGIADTIQIAPNGPGSVVSFTVENPSDFNQKLSKIQLTGVVAYPSAADRTAETNATSGCGSFDDGSVANAQAHDFYMADVTVGADGDITANASDQSISETGTLYMNDLSTDQEACKGQFLALTFTTS